jgi:hypothetical protein
MSEFEYRERAPVTAEERTAKKEKSQQKAALALAERKKIDEAFRANLERLRDERKAREETGE